jgi:peptidoglycan/LPS O-acetylase OafA/YrhL
MSVSNKIYLPNLNSIRAIAAMMVVISHIESKKIRFGLQTNTLIVDWGSIGVTLFFVLSGFLITYLLLIEKDTFQKINIKDFYIRRILRIWPLYFLAIIFVYLLVPYILPQYFSSDFDKFSIKSIFLNVFFLTNITAVLNLTPEIIGTIWSIGIEEQFYIYWPWVIKNSSNLRNKIIVGIILFLPFCKIILLFISKISENNWAMQLYYILNYTRFDIMAVGGIFGILAYKKQFTIGKLQLNYDWFTGKTLQIISYILIAICFVLPSFGSIKNIILIQILPYLFAICVLNLAINPNSIFNLECKLGSYLGKISYSLYLIHLVVIYLIFPILEPLLGGFSEFLKNIIIFTSTILIVIIISHISYNYFEKQFLKMKHKFSHITT